MGVNTTMTELVQLSYPVPDKEKVDGAEKEKSYEDLQRLLQGIAFPYEDHEGKSPSNQEIPQRCKTCKRVDCVGVCEII